MPNIIELNLLGNKSIVATMQGYPLANENSYKIIAGEENATKFIIKSIPNQYANARLTVEMVNSKGYGIEETDIGTVEINGQEYKGFNLPLGMAVAGYGYILIRAYLESENVPFQPLKVKVWNTLPDWKEDIDSGINARVVNGYLIITENGIDYNVGYVSPVKGVDYWTDEDKQEIIDEVNAEIGGPYLTEETANEKYLPKPNKAQENKAIYTLPVINNDGTVSTIVFQRSAIMGFTVVPSSGGYNIVINSAPADTIERRVDRSPITPTNLNIAVKMAITGQQRPSWAAAGKEITYGNQIKLTDEEKEAAQTWLGVKKYYMHALIFHKSGSLSFTVDRITSEPTAYLNCTTPMADNLFCTNSKSIVLNGITDISGVKSGVGTLMATMTPYDDENGENSGVRLSGVWINYATGEVSQVSNFEVPFEKDVVTEL